MASANARGSWFADDQIGDLVNLTPWFGYVEDERDQSALPPIFLRLGRDDRGRHICTGVIIGDLESTPWGPREINAAALRAVHLPELIAFALRTGEIPDEYGAAVRDLLAAVPSTATHPGRAGYDDAHYVSVAEMYRRAMVEQPGSPTKWLTETLQQTGPTVRRWLAEARRRGHLGPTEPGKAGEQS